MTDKSRKKTSFNPAALQAGSDLYHLSQAMRVGDMIWVSGQVGVDEAHVPAEGLEAQTRLAFRNLQSALEAAGATTADIVELTVYVTDLSADLEPFLRVKDEFVPPPYPAVTGVEISRLTNPELLIEIKAVAVAGAGAA